MNDRFLVRRLCPGLACLALGFFISKGEGVFASMEGASSSAPPPQAPPQVQTSPQVQAPQTTLSRENIKQALVEFDRAQWAQEQALRHQYDVDLKEWLQSQETAMRILLSKQEDDKATFFKSNFDINVRRQLLDQQKSAREEMKAAQKSELDRRSQEMQARLMDLKTKGESKRKTLIESLEQGKNPPPNVWPDSND